MPAPCWAAACRVQGHPRPCFVLWTLAGGVLLKTGRVQSGASGMSLGSESPCQQLRQQHMTQA